MVARAGYDLEVARAVYLQAFSGRRDDRSGAYKAGVMAGIIAAFRVGDRSVPYTTGTAQCDAWLYGHSEGRCRAHWHITRVGSLGA